MDKATTSIDIIAGPYWYRGGEPSSKMAFRQPRATPFDIAGDSDCYLIFVHDFNGDGWADILSFRTAGGAQVVTSKSREEFAQFMKTQTAFWAKIIKDTGVTSE